MSSVDFDGAVISVLDVKRAVVQMKRLDSAQGDFDLKLTNSATGEGIKRVNLWWGVVIFFKIFHFFSKILFL